MNQIFRLVSVIGFAVIFSLLVVIIQTEPVAFYEVSIYSAYPTFFWVFLVVSIICGITIMLCQSFHGGESSRWWLLGLTLVIISNLIFLLLSKFRNYFLIGRGQDSLSHLGFIKDIIVSGNIGQYNHYPMEHILGASLIHLSGISIENLLFLSFGIFYLVYINNIYLLANSVSQSQKQIAMIMAFASPLIYSIYHVNISPSITSLFLVGIILSLYIKKNTCSNLSLEISICLIIVVFSGIFFHPMFSLFLLFILPVFAIPNIIFILYNNNKSSKIISIKDELAKLYKIQLLILVAFFSWYLSNKGLLGSIKKVLNWLVMDETSESVFASQIGVINSAGVTLHQTTILFVNKFGAVTLLLLFSFLASASILWNYARGRSIPYRYEFTFVIMFIVSLIIGAIMLFAGDFIERNPIRIVRLALYLGTILCGLFAYNFICGDDRSAERKSPKNVVQLVAIGLLIVTLVVLSMGTTYNSPRVYLPNTQTTLEDLAGTRWLVSVQDADRSVIVNDRWVLTRFQHYLFGRESSTVRKLNIYPERLPAHFGYNENKKISHILGDAKSYMVIFMMDEIHAQHLPENIKLNYNHRNPQDLKQIENDTTASKIYVNGLIDIWYIY